MQKHALKDPLLLQRYQMQALKNRRFLRPRLRKYPMQLERQ
jgi:hypothetical protein